MGFLIKAALAQLLHKLLTYTIQHSFLSFPSREFDVFHDFVVSFELHPIAVWHDMCDLFARLGTTYPLLVFNYYRVRLFCGLRPQLTTLSGGQHCHNLAPVLDQKLQTELASVTCCQATRV